MTPTDEAEKRVLEALRVADAETQHSFACKERWDNVNAAYITTADLRLLLAALDESRKDGDATLLDVWGQFSEPTTRGGNGWRMDMGISTLEDVARTLVERGLLVKHPTKDWYRRPIADAARQRTASD